MKRKVPVIPTVIVLVAVGIMIRLGFWQIDRLHQKEAMLAQYAAASQDNTLQVWPGEAPSGKRPLPYGKVATTCIRVDGIAPQSGQNVAHQPGWVSVARCALPREQSARVVLGWSNQPAAVRWVGGEVAGTWLDKGKEGAVIVADPPLAGLQPNAKPDPRDLPNNHLAYAVQWFSFAVVALVIYALALRKRWLG